MPGFLMVHLNILVNVLGFALLAFIEPSYQFHKFMSFDSTYGFFGWMSSEYFVLAVFVVGPIAGVLGAGAYIYLLFFFSSTVVMNMMLLEPFISQIFGILLGQDNFPAAITIFSGIGIVIGLCLTIRGGDLKQSRSILESIRLSYHANLTFNLEEEFKKKEALVSSDQIDQDSELCSLQNLKESKTLQS